MGYVSIRMVRRQFSFGWMESTGRYVLMYSRSELSSDLFSFLIHIYANVYDYDLRLSYDCVDVGMACLWIIVLFMM